MPLFGHGGLNSNRVRQLGAPPCGTNPRCGGQMGGVMRTRSPTTGTAFMRKSLRKCRPMGKPEHPPFPIVSIEVSSPNRLASSLESHLPKFPKASQPCTRRSNHFLPLLPADGTLHHVVGKDPKRHQSTDFFNRLRMNSAAFLADLAIDR